MFCTVLYDGQGLMSGGESIEVNSMCNNNMLQSCNLAVNPCQQKTLHETRVASRFLSLGRKIQKVMVGVGPDNILVGVWGHAPQKNVQF